MDITVIIPVHNSEKYLRECIESVLDQGEWEKEVLCIDSGKDDASFEIIDEMRKRDGCIKYIFDENTSYGHKINTGIKHAKGRYIAILEADDMMSPHMLDKLYSVAEQYDADVVDADFYQMFSYKDKNYFNPVKKYADSAVYNCLIECGDGIFEKTDFKAIWTAIYKRDFLINQNIQLNESEGASFQDSSFIVLVNMFAKRIYHLDIPFYKYRIDNSGSSVKSEKKVFEIIGEYEFLKNDLLKRGTLDRKKWVLYYKSKYDAFYWNYRRLSPKSREIFLEKYVEELKQDNNSGNIGRETFQGEMYEYTYQLLDDMASFVNGVSENENKPLMVKLLEELEKIVSGELVVFGAGAWGTRVTDFLTQNGIKLDAICDNSKVLQGTVKAGIKVISVEAAVGQFPNAVYLLASRNYGKDMKEQLLNEKVREEQIMIFE